MHKDKRQPYEFDTKIPLYVRGPGVRQNVVEETLISLVDLAPTILDMAKVVAPSKIDGTSFLPWLLENNEVEDWQLQLFFLKPKCLVFKTVYQQVNDPTGQESIYVSYHGEGSADTECDGEFYPNMIFCEAQFDCKCQDSLNNTYSCVR